MTDASRLAADVAAQVKTLLNDMIGTAAKTRSRPTKQVRTPAPVSGAAEPGWHPYAPIGVPEQDQRPGYPVWQPWAQLRVIEAITAGSLVLVLFADRDGPEFYLYSEDAAAYEDLLSGNTDADASFVARLLITHLDEQIGGIGWQQTAGRAHTGQVVVLTGQAEPRIE